MAVQDEREGARGRTVARSEAPLFAALDLGTNNCRLLIAAAGPGGRFRIVDSFSRVIRLGEGLAQTGVLSDDAIARTIDALKVCASHLRRHNVVRLRAVATEACRRAENADVLVARAREEAGIDLEIVTVEEEAHLAALGAAPLVGRRYRGALVFDVGGGSTEVIWLKRSGKKVRNVFSSSVPVGVVTLAEDSGTANYESLRASIRPLFHAVKQRMARAGEFKPHVNHLLGTSGTVTTLAGIALALPRYDRARVDGSWHSSIRMLEIAEDVAGRDLRGRADMPCIGAERAELMLPGLAIFSAIALEWPCAELRVADRGLREGILLELVESN